MSKRSEQLSQMTLVVMGLGDREAKRPRSANRGFSRLGLNVSAKRKIVVLGRYISPSPSWELAKIQRGLLLPRIAGVELQGRRLAKDGYPGRR